jgi:hypothetical protein
MGNTLANAQPADEAKVRAEPIFHERALWSLEDIALYSRFSVSLLRDKVVCLPDFPPAVRITPKAHPRWPAGQVWNFFESRTGKHADTVV